MRYLCISVRPHCQVTNAYTSAWLHHLNVLDGPKRWRLPVSQSELICKWSKVVSPAGGARGDGAVERRIVSQWWTYPSVLSRSQCTRRDESIEHTSKSIRADLQKFETGQTWRSRKSSTRKNSEMKVNDGRTPASMHRLNVLDESSQLSLPGSQSELICKRSKGVSPAGGGGGGGGGVEQRIESQ